MAEVPNDQVFLELDIIEDSYDKVNEGALNSWLGMNLLSRSRQGWSMVPSLLPTISKCNRPKTLMREIERLLWPSPSPGPRQRRRAHVWCPSCHHCDKNHSFGTGY